ncbi:reverse transcriptase domain-containing protein [Tanacetum coccineum]
MWTREADKAFEDINKYIEKLPTLVVPKARESLIIYLAALMECVSAVLIVERGKDQRPIYSVSRVLQGAKLNYPIMEKLVLSLVHVVRRLKRLHVGPISIVAKITTLGYYWPSMHRDATEIIQSYDACQIHSLVSRLPKQDMTSVTAVWPFIQWDIDIVGPLPEAPGKVKFLIVAVDYFTKYVEAKPLANITGKHVERFMWEHIVCHFGIPQMRVSDNKKQFEEGMFPQFRERLKIKQALTYVYHPQANGLTKVTNKEIVKGLEKGSEERIKDGLTYETEAVLPIEISVPTKRKKKVDLILNEKDLRINLEILEERREIVAMREDTSKKKLEKYYNKKVRPTVYKPRDYVLRLNSASKAEYTGKMGPTWKGPYKILEADSKGAYVLSTLKGREIQRTWNRVNLQKCYM